MRQFIVFLSFDLITSQGLNVIQCDTHSTIFKSCYLREFDQTWITKECGYGYDLSATGVCVAPCESGTYLYGESCLPCAENCSECFGPKEFQCKHCSSQYTLNFHGLCSLKCDAAQGAYGLPQDGSSPNQCLECDESCLSCFHGYATSCTACPGIDATGSTFRLKPFWYSLGRTNSGYCIKDPSISGYFRQYPNDNVIVQCPVGCSKCVDRFKCTACLTGYSLYPPEAYSTEYALCYADQVVTAS